MHPDLCPGIPWIAEFLSHLVTHKQGPEESFEFRTLIDTLNLFTVGDSDYIIFIHYKRAHGCCQGVLVFVVLVCKQKTIRRVARSLSRSESTHYRTQSSRFGSTYTTRSPYRKF